MPPFASLRGLLFAGRQLSRIADALDRLADVAEGKVPPPTPLPEAEDDRVRTWAPNDRELAAAYAIEQRLRGTLGREPTEEEILRELDEVPWREEMPDGGEPQ